MRRSLLTILLSISAIVAAIAADPTATTYPWSDCQGSAKPYPTPRQAYDYPDTLTPVMINHVGRHGARFPATPKHTATLLKALDNAEKAGTITARGRELKKIANTVTELSNGRWGALDSLGIAEQRGIASRMYAGYPELFSRGQVNAISSYAPRCIMSMYEFCHQLSRLDNKVEINTASGRRYSPLMRFFDGDKEYTELRKSGALTSPLDDFMTQTIPLAPLKRVLGDKYPFDESANDIAMAEYSVLAGLSAIEMECDITRFFTPEEYNALWSVFNLRQYLQHAASTVSAIPADIASPLLLNLINTTDAFISGDQNIAPVNLRFGHAETLMPLLSLMHLQGCYYLTNYFDTVALHWRDFAIVPMAANLQMILFRSDSGKYYLRVDLNEIPVPLIPNDDAIYQPWTTARQYLERCIPLYY